MNAESQRDDPWEVATQKEFWWLNGDSLVESEREGKLVLEVKEKDLGLIEGGEDSTGDFIPIEMLRDDVANSLREASRQSAPCFICVRGKNQNGALKLERYLIISKEPEKLVGLAANELPDWHGALSSAPEDVKTSLQELTLRLFATGELRAALETVKNGSGWPNSNTRIIDQETWQTMRKLVAGFSGIGEFSNNEERCFVREADVGSGCCILALRCAKLSFYPDEGLLLAYRAKQFDYTSEEFQKSAEKMLSESRLLVTDSIVQRICSFHKPLFGRILDYLEDSQIQMTWFVAKRHIVDSLRNYTHNVTGQQPKQIEPPSFCKQLAEDRCLDLDNLTTLSDRSTGEQERIDSLDNLGTTASGGKAGDFHSFIIPLLERRKVGALSSQVDLLATFDFSLHREIACAKLDQLPAAEGITYPAVKAEEVTPILLQRRIERGNGNGFAESADCQMDWKFRRHVVLLANIQIYELRLQAGKQALRFGLAEWDHNLTEADARKAMDLLAHRRLPLHERRVLQLLQIPCRESVDDMEELSMGRVLADSDDRSQKGGLPALLDAERCDDALLRSIDEVLELRRSLNLARSQEDVAATLQEFTFDEEGTFPADSALASIEVLRRIVRFSHVEHLTLREWLEARRSAFRRRGSRLLETMIEWVQVLVQEGAAALKKRDLSTEMRIRLWSEFQTVFPDNRNWIGFKRNAAGTSEGVSLFAETVLHALFQRPFLGEHDKPHALPKRELQLALQSVQRIHRMSAVFPVCCGDWTTEDYFKNLGRMRRVAESRIFASIKPGTNRDARLGGLVMADESLLSEATSCFKSQCLHAPNHKSPIKLLFWQIAEAVGQIEPFLETLARCGFWLNTIIDIEAHHHFRCGGCARLLVPDPYQTKAYYFTCPQWNDAAGPSHDKNVYLNWCMGCAAVIDSREGAKCSNGKVICIECGHCCPDHRERAPKEGGPACFHCRRRLDAYSSAKNSTLGPSSVNCVCGVENHVYGKSDRENPDDKKSAMWPGKRLSHYNIRHISEDLNDNQIPKMPDRKG